MTEGRETAEWNHVVWLWHEVLCLASEAVEHAFPHS